MSNNSLKVSSMWLGSNKAIIEKTGGIIMSKKDEHPLDRRGLVLVLKMSLKKMVRSTKRVPP